MSDPTTAPELADIVWRDRDGDHWRFTPDGRSNEWVPDSEAYVDGAGWNGWYVGCQKTADALYGPLVAVGHLPAWTGPDDDVEPDVPATEDDDVPAVTE